MQNKIKLKILGISYSQIQKGAYALLLAEERGYRRIPIVIGTPEAQSIAICLEHIVPPRPLAHDLFVTCTHSFGIRLIEVNIYRFEEGIFSAEMVLEEGNRQVLVDCRTSDAIAIALRTQAPIYIEESILKLARSAFQNKTGETVESEELAILSDNQLRKKLKEAIDSEQYEQAAQLHSELKRRAAFLK